MNNIETFITKNIKEINSKISKFKDTKGDTTPNDTEIKDFLREKFLKELPVKKNELLNEIKEHNYVKTRIDDIANKYVFYKKDLENFYHTNLYQELMEKVDIERLVNSISEKVKEDIDDNKAYAFIKSDLEKIAEKLACLLKLRGFSTNFLGINDGIMLANSGDSSQFLFLSRAILAGFNCSNVDVRSSRYDAIIDYDGKLLKVQVKGLSNNQVSFKDRDRGGQGIDHTHEKNRGKMITSDDCDIYVAVDKQCGICYIIPMEDYVDKLSIDIRERAINVKALNEYKENWEIIKNVANKKIVIIK